MTGTATLIETPSLQATETKQETQPDKQPQVKQGDDQAVSEIVQELGESNGPLSKELSFATRQALEVLEAGGDRYGAYELKGKYIIEEVNSSKTNLDHDQRQERIAVGLDMQIEGLSMQYQDLAAKTQKAIGKNKEEISQKLKELKNKINKVANEREKINLPNQLSEFAQLFGMTEEQASKSPLAQVETYINVAINDSKFRQEMITNLENNDELQSDDAKKIVAAFKDFLNAQGNAQDRKKTVEKGLKTVGKVALGACLMSLLMMFMSKEKKQGMTG